MQNVEVMIKGTDITVSVGESKNLQKTHILVTTPGFIKKELSGRGSSIDLSHVKMVIFDEADELFNNLEVQGALEKIISQKFVELSLKPQYVLFSATVDEKTTANVERFINDPTPTSFLCERQAIKLQNVR